jgi:hypothetical protein
MATYRLGALGIFLILLAVLLIAYLMNHVWENFTSKYEEGFGVLENYKEIVTGYGDTGIVKLYESDLKKLYFDPIARSIVEPIEDSKLKITDRNNQLTTHAFVAIAESITADPDLSIVPSSNPGFIYVINKKSENFEQHKAKAQNLGGNITSVKDKAENDEIFSIIEADADLIGDGKHGGIFLGGKRKDSPNSNDWEWLDGSTWTAKIPTNSQSQGQWDPWSKELPWDKDHKVNQPDNHNNNENILEMWKDGTWNDGYSYNTNPAIYKIPIDNYIVGGKAASSTTYAYSISEADPDFAAIHIPLSGTSVTFIHILDLKENRHKDIWYFNGDTVIEKPMESVKISSTFTNSSYADISGTILEFELTYENEMKALADGDFVVNTTHLVNVDHPAVKIVCRKKETVGYSSFRLLLTFDQNNKPLIGKVETSSAEDGDTVHTDDDSDDDSDDDKWAQLRKLQASLFGPYSSGYPYYGDYDGSPYSDYLLKTEVVPPVCPACPSCTDKGVCSNCGGKGGSGTQDELKESLIKEFGSGIDSFLRDGAGGADSLVRDTAKGTVDLAKETASGVVDTASKAGAGAADFAKSSASGVGDYAKDAASGTYGAASEVVTGTVGLGREVVGGAYNAGASVAGGAYNAGASVAGGAYDIASGAVNALGQAIPNYGAPGGVQGPNAQMGGQQNAYGGGYSNPGGVPATAGQDPYSYFGSVPPRPGTTYMPRTANFSAFGK